MTVRNDKELIRNIRELSYACLPGWIDGDMGGLRALVVYDSLIEYIDEHYIPKPDITTMEDIRTRAAEINVPDNFVEKKRVAAVTEMTIDRALQDALTAIRYYEDCHSEEWPCLQDVESRVLSVIDKLEGLSIV